MRRSISSSNNDAPVGPPTGGELPEGGVSSWTDYFAPIDGVVQILEGVQSATGLPWWATIVSSTVALRVLLFPVQLGAQRTSAKISHLQPEIKIARQQMEKNGGMTNAEATSEFQARQREIYARAGVNPIKALLSPLSQAPIFLCMFFGLRRLAVDNAGMASGGALWFTDLASSDSTLALPILAGASMLLSSEYVQSRMLNPTPIARTVRWVLRVFAVAIVPLTAYMPAAVHLYWVTTNACTLFQSILFHTPKTRAFFGIPAVYSPSITDKSLSYRSAEKVVKPTISSTRKPKP